MFRCRSCGPRGKVRSSVCLVTLAVLLSACAGQERLVVAEPVCPEPPMLPASVRTYDPPATGLQERWSALLQAELQSLQMDSAE